MAIEMENKRFRDLLVVRLAGELDHHSVEEVRQEINNILDKGYIKHILFNLQELHFMDSAGLGMVLGRYKALSAMGGTLSICGAKPQVQKLFQLSGIDKIARMYETEDEALRAMGVVTHE